MKLQVNFDKQAIGEFFLYNAEKIVFGGVVLCALLIIYREFGTERFSRLPTDLGRNAAEAAKHVEATDPPKEGQEILDYPGMVKLQPVKADLYEFPVPLDVPVFDPRGKRGMPRLFPVRALRGTADVGKLMVSKKASNGKRWVVLTGSVPVVRQFEEFTRCFNMTVKVAEKKTNPDTLQYNGYVVERTEVGSQGTQQEPVIIEARDALAAASKWDGKAEIVDARYITGLAFPLGPLVGKKWGLEVDHPGLYDSQTTTIEKDFGTHKVAAEINTSLSAEGIAVSWERVLYFVDPDSNNRAEDYHFFVVDYRGVGNASAHFGKTEAVEETATLAGTVGITLHFDSKEFYASIDGRDGARQTAGPADQPAKRKIRLTVPLLKAKPADNKDEKTFLPGHCLFRFFDFSVQPGKKYRYQVKLQAKNPNFGVDPRYLAKPEFAAAESIESPLSGPSPVIVVPRDTRVLAVSVTQRAGVDLGRVKVTKWIMNEGIRVHKEFDVKRGTMINFPGERWPDTPQSKKGDASDLPAKAKKKGVQAPIDVDYMAESLVLDMHGGERIASGSPETVPGEILLLDPDGRLVVHNEIDDMAAARTTEVTVSGAGDEEAVPATDKGGGEEGGGLEGFD